MRLRRRYIRLLIVSLNAAMAKSSAPPNKAPIFVIIRLKGFVARSKDVLLSRVAGFNGARAGLDNSFYKFFRASGSKTLGHFQRVAGDDFSFFS